MRSQTCTDGNKVQVLTGEIMSWAKTRLMLKSPFLGGLISGLLVMEDKDLGAIMATDGYSISWNSDCGKIPDVKKAHVVGVMAHEIGHIIYRHVCTWISKSELARYRSEGKDAYWKHGVTKREPYWTIAQELVVNELVINMFDLTLPGSPFYDSRYFNKTDEQIYYELLKEAPPESGEKLKVGTLGGPVLVKTDGSEIDGILDLHVAGDEPMTREDREKLRSHVKDILARATQGATLQGNMPTSLRLLIGEIQDPQLPWRQLIEPFIRDVSKGDYSMMVPDRRYLHTDFYLPGISSEGINIGVAIDLSGSVGKEERTEFWSEVKNGAMAVCQDYTIHLFGCDASISEGGYQVATPTDEVDLSALMAGGGGTDFRPVFDMIKENDIKIDVLFYLTDTYGNFPAEAPDYPVMWIVKGGGTVPWGERVQLED